MNDRHKKLGDTSENPRYQPTSKTPPRPLAAVTIVNTRRKERSQRYRKSVDKIRGEVAGSSGVSEIVEEERTETPEDKRELIVHKGKFVYIPLTILARKLNNFELAIEHFEALRIKMTQEEFIRAGFDFTHLDEMIERGLIVTEGRTVVNGRARILKVKLLEYRNNPSCFGVSDQTLKDLEVL